jgi:hypothetical protein
MAPGRTGGPRVAIARAAIRATMCCFRVSTIAAGVVKRAGGAEQRSVEYRVTMHGIVSHLSISTGST